MHGASRQLEDDAYCVVQGCIMEQTQRDGDSIIDAVSFGGGKICYQSPTVLSVRFGDYPNWTDVQAQVKCWPMKQPARISSARYILTSLGWALQDFRFDVAEFSGLRALLKPMQKPWVRPLSMKDWNRGPGWLDV